MLRIATLVVATFVLTACVSEQSYLDAQKREKKIQFDKAEAAKARLLLALSYLDKNDRPQAKLNLDKALELSPNLPEVHSSRAYFYQRIGENLLAENAYQKALTLAPEDPDIQNNYGTFLCAQGQYSKAGTLIQAAIKSPNYSKVGRSYYNLALCQIEQSLYKSALNNLIKANKYEPTAADILYMGAALNYGFTDNSSAVSWYQEYASQNDPDAEGLLLGVSLYRITGMDEQAKMLATQLQTQHGNSKEWMLLNSNQILISRHEQLKRKMVRTLGLTETVSNVSSSHSHVSSNQVIKDGIHALTVINKEAALPEETMVVEEVSPSEQQVMSRVPVLEISNRKVKVPKYKVQHGENLYRVSVKFNIQMNTLMKWNNLKKQQVNAGQLLYIHNPDVYYVVENEEMLSAIADKLQIDLDKLMSWNQVLHDGLVRAGTRIIKVDVEQFEP